MWWTPHWMQTLFSIYSNQHYLAVSIKILSHADIIFLNSHDNPLVSTKKQLSPYNIITKVGQICYAQDPPDFQVNNSQRKSLTCAVKPTLAQCITEVWAELPPDWVPDNSSILTFLIQQVVHAAQAYYQIQRFCHLSYSCITMTTITSRRLAHYNNTITNHNSMTKIIKFREH